MIERFDLDTSDKAFPLMMLLENCGYKCEGKLSGLEVAPNPVECPHGQAVKFEYVDTPDCSRYSLVATILCRSCRKDLRRVFNIADRVNDSLRRDS